ncbi:MAG: SAM-dependent methyltransferase [Opitutaceae bacterium]|nr:SAM-dependent methyltransferase [Opitutaceae bacterium]
MFRAHADEGADGVLRMRFDRFMGLALYNPATGYYRGGRKRVGRGGGTDFFTASTSGPVFGELVCAAAVKRLRENDARANPRDYVFVEIGAEPGGGVLAGVKHPFGGERTIRVGTAIMGNLALRGKCVVFSNELFDAQPFRRFVFRGGAWRELGVAMDGETEALRELGVAMDEEAGALRECEMPGSADPWHDIGTESPDWRGVAFPEGYHLDLPLEAVILAREIAAQPWHGLFLACDYGKSWRELIEATPAGTARAYFRHTQSNDLLANPGEQDLTCHICWDWLVDELREDGFVLPEPPEPPVASQESFFVHHAGDYLAKAFAGDAPLAAAAGTRKRALMQLLHPAHMGQKFQVLHAVRGPEAGNRGPGTGNAISQ